MYVILTYDINKKRVSKALKICRKYLSHRQRSVFDGIITGAKLDRLKSELKILIDPEIDSVHIYEFDSLKFSRKEEIGLTMTDDNIV